MFSPLGSDIAVYRPRDVYPSNDLTWSEILMKALAPAAFWLVSLDVPNVILPGPEAGSGR
jgi:hypothetical protein